MNLYEFNTLAEEMETFAFSMDTYFANMKGFERTGQKAYRTAASENLAEAKASYKRLQAFAKKQ